MKTYIFLYQEAALFEVVVTSYLLKTIGDIVVITDQEKEIHTTEGLVVSASCLLDEVNPEEVDILIIVGGNIDEISNKDLLHNLIKEVNNREKIIGAICAGRKEVINALNLNRKENNITETINKRIVLSPGNEYVDFAIEVGKVADIYQDTADLEETINFFKKFMLV